MPPRSASREPARAAHLGPERRRPDVLAVASELFIRRGYNDVSMADIAEAAGVTKPVVYACFDSKPQLFAEVRRAFAQRIFETVAAAIRGADAEGDPERMIEAGLTVFLRAAAAEPDAFRFVYLSPDALGGEVGEAIRQARARNLDEIEALAHRAVRDLGLSEERARARSRVLAYAIAGVGESAVRAILNEPERWRPEELAHELAAVLVRGMAPPGG